MSQRYELRRSNPKGEVDWLQELETWKQRTQNQFRWEHLQVKSGIWEARFIREGRDKKAAERHAAMQLDSSPIPILPLHKTNGSINSLPQTYTLFHAMGNYRLAPVKRFRSSPRFGLGIRSTVLARAIG
ncbi:hypothetical protein BDV93DRAFT_511506 [Ceratobasidium sp. AG-I]|nr:hypothetical protein BDV93DRAFT_511506 [Ceratobasidium sp. AG-I]